MRERRAIGIAGLAALVSVLVLTLLVPRAVAGGWLIAFVVMSAVPIGSLAWLLIHRLTGGRWGVAIESPLRRGFHALPLLAILFVPLLLMASTIYPWVARPDSEGSQVVSFYLNRPFFASRGLLMIVGLSVIAWIFGRGQCGRLSAGLSLVFYVISMNLVAVDWLLSLAPRYTSSAFGAQIIILQFGMALAFAILMSDRTMPLAVRGDLGALLLATTLGETYLILMTFIIHWYGNLPDQADWYLTRSQGAWSIVEVAGILIGAIGPILALLFSTIRQTVKGLHSVAALVLAGGSIEIIWLVAPVTGLLSIPIAIVATCGMVGLAYGFSDLRGVRVEEVEHGL